MSDDIPGGKELKYSPETEIRLKRSLDEKLREEFQIAQEALPFEIKSHASAIKNQIIRTTRPSYWTLDEIVGVQPMMGPASMKFYLSYNFPVFVDPPMSPEKRAAYCGFSSVTEMRLALGDDS